VTEGSSRLTARKESTRARLYALVRRIRTRVPEGVLVFQPASAMALKSPSAPHQRCKMPARHRSQRAGTNGAVLFHLGRLTGPSGSTTTPSQHARHCFKPLRRPNVLDHAAALRGTGLRPSSIVAPTFEPAHERPTTSPRSARPGRSVGPCRRLTMTPTAATPRRPISPLNNTMTAPPRRPADRPANRRNRRSRRPPPAGSPSSTSIRVCQPRGVGV